MLKVKFPKFRYILFTIFFLLLIIVTICTINLVTSKPIVFVGQKVIKFIEDNQRLPYDPCELVSRGYIESNSFNIDAFKFKSNFEYDRVIIKGNKLYDAKTNNKVYLYKGPYMFLHNSLYETFSCIWYDQLTTYNNITKPNND